MSTTTTYTGVRIVDMPDLGAVTDDSSVVGEHAGSGRFAATAFRTYVAGLGTGNIGRNLLHNPLFNIQQRGQGTFTAQGYTLDRWNLAYSGGDTASVGANAFGDAGRVAIGDEAASWALQNVFTGNTAGFTMIQQRIEGVRRLAGKTVTVSFWAGAASAGLRLGACVEQFFGTGGTPSAYAAGVGQSVGINIAAARYALTFTVPSVSGKTFGTNGDDATYLTVWYSASPTYNARSGGVGVQSGQVVLWGMQLEIGSVATPLDKPYDYGADLRNCQRFYQAGDFYWVGYAPAAYFVGNGLQFATPMRAAPTMVLSAQAYTGLSAASADNISVAGIRIIATSTTAGAAQFSTHWTASADL